MAELFPEHWQDLVNSLIVDFVGAGIPAHLIAITAGVLLIIRHLLNNPDDYAGSRELLLCGAVLAAWRRKQEILINNEPTIAAQKLVGIVPGSASVIASQIASGAHYIQRATIPIRAGVEGDWDLGISTIAMPSPITYTLPWSRITAEHSGKALHVNSDNSHANGSTIMQYNWENREDQKFEIRYLNGLHHIVAKHSGKVVEIPRSSKEAGQRAEQYQWASGANQQYRLIQVGWRRYIFIAAHSGMCLEVYDKRMDNKALVAQNRLVGGLNQIWRIDPV